MCVIILQKKTIGIIKGDIIFNNLRNIGKKFNYDINKDFRRRINKRIYSWYVDGDFLLLRYHRGAFREDIIEKCVFCKTEDNGIEHVTNNCVDFKKIREELIDKFNKLEANTKNKELLEIIDYYYCRNYLNLKLKKRMIIMELN